MALEGSRPFLKDVLRAIFLIRETCTGFPEKVNDKSLGGARLPSHYVENYATNQPLELDIVKFTVAPNINKSIKDNQQGSQPKRQFSEFFVSNYSSTSSHIVSEMSLEF